MLADIYNQVFTTAKEYIAANSPYNALVTKRIPEQSGRFPVVTIAQIQDRLEDETLKKTEQKVLLVFEVNVFAQDTEEKNGLEIIDELKSLVDVVFTDQLGMTREMDEPMDNLDRYVRRQYMRYSCILNMEDKRIFRRN
jgi:hypothetical protein